MVDQPVKKTLKENCGNCGYFVWHDLRIQYDMCEADRGTICTIVTIPNPITGSCTHMLMKKWKKCRDLSMSECLFWLAVGNE